MRIGIIGGTGKQGTGIAKRILANTDHFVFIGSRKEEKGIKHAEYLAQEFEGKNVQGGSNAQAIANTDVIIAAIPFESLESILIVPFKNELKDKIIIDCVNPLVFNKKGVFLNQPEGKSVTEWLSEKLGESRVVSGFKTISSSLLNSMDPIEQDCFVASDDKEAKALVKQIVEESLNTRVIDAGPSFTARYLEAMTALAININMKYKTKDAAFKSTLKKV